MESVSSLEGMLAEGGPHIVFNVLRFLHTVSIYALSTVSYTMRQMVLLYLQEDMNIDTYLGHWFNDPQHFCRSLMYADAIVAGLAPLYFLQRYGHHLQRLDIFVEYAGVRELG